MKDVDILKDILQYRIFNQTMYNENIINVRNPEAKQLFTQTRDDEMRDIVKLQQRIERLETNPGIIAKLFPTKSKY